MNDSELMTSGARSPAETAVRVLVGGVVLALIELAIVFSSAARALFLGFGEQLGYLAGAFSTGVLSVGVMTLLGRSVARFSRDSEVRARLVGILTFACALVFLYLLTSGRRVHDAPWRAPAVTAAAAMLAVSAHRLHPRLEAALRSPHALFAAVGVVLATLALVLDLRILHRLYPAFHVGLALIAVMGITFAAFTAPLPARVRPALRSERAGALSAVPVLVAIVALVQLGRIVASPNLSFVVGEYAGVSGKWVELLRSLERSSSDGGTGAVFSSSGDGTSDRRSGGEVADRPGLELESRDTLLITVDALRADRLAVYGGQGLTPELDALARESAVFDRAYTPTPHTSYALSSLLTGKYLRPVLELPNAPSEHVAVPELLRRYGVRTAAFYPPAIFYVDAHRFEALQEGHFGFEYNKEMYAPAHDRIAQVAEYLDVLEAEGSGERDVFVWVHLFEPHEPYEALPRFERGDSAEERYDAEVAAADDAIGELVRMFRARRPGATVIVSADHGEEFGDHGGLYHGSTLYEEQVRVPLLWSSPGVVDPRRIEAPVELVDVTTTLLAGLGIPRDARMRGDDLGPLLMGAATGPQYAFAEIAEARMVTDGRWKAICETDGAACRLYDLDTDPGELRNRAAEETEVLARLRRAIGEFVGSIPAVEAMALEGEGAWPQALARAELGDVGAAPDVVPLLGDGRASVRAAAARAMGRLGYRRARGILSRLRQNDTDAAVVAEAALAELILSEDTSADPEDEVFVAVRSAATAADADSDFARRAALALASRGDGSLRGVLEAVAADASADEEARRAAIVALGRLGGRESVATLVEVLNEVRLRPDAADALGRIGDRRAMAPLRRALDGERYVPARAAEAAALVALRDPTAARRIRRFLGMEHPLPGGVALLRRVGDLERPSGRGVDVAAALRVREGSWECSDEGCVPGSGASLAMPRARAPRGAVRVILLTRSATGGQVTVGDETRDVAAGEQQIAFSAEGPLTTLPISTAGGVAIVAIVVVPSEEEIPPPPPEPVEDANEARDSSP